MLNEIEMPELDKYVFAPPARGMPEYEYLYIYKERFWLLLTYLNNLS